MFDPESFSADFETTASDEPEPEPTPEPEPEFDRTGEGPWIFHGVIHITKPRRH